MIRALSIPLFALLSAAAVCAPVASSAESSRPVKAIDDETLKWQEDGTAQPVRGPDGLLLYPYGQDQPTLVCRPLYGCDIQLETGETINNVMIGDSARWITAKAKTGSDPATYHVVLKPTRIGIGTNLLITTSKRSYMLILKASDTGTISRMGWYYPADLVQDWSDHEAAAKKTADDDAKLNVGAMPITSINQLNLDGYKISGDRSLPWYPVRVFDDGTHVWIQMSKAAASSDAPALVLINSAGDSELVNYRLKPGSQGGQDATFYIVDKIFDNAALIAGVGDDQQKIEITRLKKSPSLFESLFR